VASDTGALGPLEEALQAVPGVYMTTQVHGRRLHGKQPGVVFTNPAWPAGYCSPWAASGGWHIKIGEVRQLPEPLAQRGRPGVWWLTPGDEAAALAQLAREGS
jgi:hypothetical protein